MIAKNNLKNILKTKNINLSELSRQTGMAYSSIYRIFTNEYLDDIRLSSLIKVGKSIGVSVNDMYTLYEE
ncbi:helix-turn-helix transcriptional regulator [Anaerococcus vaginalis]|uniref:helix-turn-helix domain-containing protein n=1 Tax=Anaerococcus vaginalis TaxID=33037 RepID=UPI002912072A|nr:helix-turn-helix transcriptional regulator [Anaerococcus vaginalis]MDU5252715.1 helix-turn-helix transcriptional regulator [Anaerococcus vaginalis]MDU6782241.1 helix-turn-helix transcriptional regulator [Anaerococcus vaginalis]